MESPDPEPVNSLDVAEFLGTEHRGHPVRLTDVNGLGAAGNSELSFSTYDGIDPVVDSDAGAVICPADLSEIEGKTLLPSSDPQLAFLRVVDEFFSPDPTGTIVHPTATIGPDAVVGDGSIIGANVYVDSCVTLGDDCRVFPGTNLGSKGKGYVRDEDGRLLSHRYRGTVVVEDEVSIGCGCVVDRAIFGETRIGEGTKLDNLIHVAHDNDVGARVWINQLTSLAGNVTVEDEVRIHPAVSIAHGLTIGRGATVGSNSTVLDDVDPEALVVGSPAE